MLPLELDATGARTVKFDVRLGSGRTVHLEAVADPVMAGFNSAIELFRGEAIDLSFLTDKAKMAWALAFPRPGDVRRLVESWLEAIGISRERVGVLFGAVDHLELVEADLQRFYGLDLGSWPRGELSTRRLAVLIEGLRHRPDSLFWSEIQSEFDPMSTEAVILAGIFGALTEKPHPLLMARKNREEAAQKAAAMERMTARGLTAGD